MGYQDVIRLLYGYAPQAQAIVGMQVLASKETPGLGDKIEKDPAFMPTFARWLSPVGGRPGAAATDRGSESGTKTWPSQIDGITGATISSKAVAAILRQSSTRWVPVVYRLQAELAQQGGPDAGQ